MFKKVIIAAALGGSLIVGVPASAQAYGPVDPTEGAPWNKCTPTSCNRDRGKAPTTLCKRSVVKVTYKQLAAQRCYFEQRTLKRSR